VNFQNGFGDQDSTINIVEVLLFFNAGTQFPGNEKIMLCNTKSTKIKLE